ncbi:MAG: hypothetical protein KDA95_10630 [Acidimicrobiales bacterium]|nr:hypothetical protein [Acidimicrobiales bacterium]
MATSNSADSKSDHPDTPSLQALVEGVHRSGVHESGSHMLRVKSDPLNEEFELGVHILNDELAHPLDCLVGLRAPESWYGVGLATSGTAHHFDGKPSERIHFTYMMDRDGRSTSIIEPLGGSEVILADRPQGWCYDVLARVLGLSTTAPSASTALLLDMWWLDAIVTAAEMDPRSVRTWRSLARMHPLNKSGEKLGPSDLAARTTSEALSRPWWMLRQRMWKVELPAAKWAPKGEGEILTAGQWFDDGAMCRWMMRELPETDVLVTEVLRKVPAHLVEHLLDGVVEANLTASAA